MGLATMEESTTKFSQYPVQVDNYFTNKEIVIKVFPKDFLEIVKNEHPDIHITSAQQYYDYLCQEKDFWSENDPRNVLNEFSNKDRLSNAKMYFESAVKNPSSATSYLGQSINSLSEGCVYSKTRLAQVLLDYTQKNSYFLSGLLGCLKGNPSTNITTVGGLDGYFAGKSFLNLLQEYTQSSERHLLDFQENMIIASSNYATLNKRYTNSFHHHEDKVNQFTQKVDSCIEEMKKKQDSYFLDAEARLKRKEELYEEKLRLQAPADYWAKLKTNYSIIGVVWLLISVAIAIGTVLFLGFTLFKGENFLTEEADWIDNVKSSAILTVITSIAIYVLRLTSKMALSSFHLSRDAKERESLAYFYLALIEKKAVSDKERAIVLNALFSRSDTGLLKGDATPTMSSNVSDLVDVLKTSKP